MVPQLKTPNTNNEFHDSMLSPHASPKDLMLNKVEVSDWGMADLEDLIGDCRRNLGVPFEQQKGYAPRSPAIKPKSFNTAATTTTKKKKGSRKSSASPMVSLQRKQPSSSSNTNGKDHRRYSNDHEEKKNNNSVRGFARGAFFAPRSNSLSKLFATIEKKRKAKQRENLDNKSSYRKDDRPLVGKKYMGSVVAEVKEETVKCVRDNQCRVHKKGQLLLQVVV